MTRIAPVLLRRQGRPRLGGILGAATVPLRAMAVSGERGIVPPAAPNHSRGNRFRRPQGV